MPRLDERNPSCTETERFVLVGDRRRVCRRLAGRGASQAWFYTAELGRLVLHVWAKLQAEVQPLARASISLRQRRRLPHVQCRGPASPCALGAGAGLWRQAGESYWPIAGRHLDPATARHARGRDRLPTDGRHLVLQSRRRHLQGTARVSRLPNAGATTRADRADLFQPGRLGARSVQRQRHDARRGEETGP